VSVGSIPPGVSEKVIAIGKIAVRVLPPAIVKPIFLCKFKDGAIENLALDSNPRCTGEGKVVQPNAIGYASQQIQNGYILMGRCKSPKHGMYNTLNPKCDSPEDRFQISLGAVLLEK
jgi:hypothetical protein